MNDAHCSLIKEILQKKCNKLMHSVIELKCLLSQLQPAEGVPVTSLTHQAAASTSSNTEPVHSVFKKAMERLASLFPEYSRCWLY